MSKPNSIKTQPWTSYGKFSTNAFNDDFCHKDHFTLKVKSTSRDDATINIKQAGNTENGNVTIKDELKFWFPLKNGAQSFLYSKINNKSVSVLYDHGITTISDRKVNFYGKLNFEKTLANIELKTGFEVFFQNLQLNNRFRLTQNGNLTWYNRSLYTHNEFRFGLIAAYDITKNILAKKDLLLGYIKNPYSVFLRAEQDWDKSSTNFSNLKTFNKLSLSALWDRTNVNRNGLQVNFNPVKGTLSEINALVEYTHKDLFIKSKINNKGDIALVLRRKINDSTNLSVGGDYAALGKEGLKKVGAQIQINV